MQGSPQIFWGLTEKYIIVELMLVVVFKCGIFTRVLLIALKLADIIVIYNNMHTYIMSTICILTLCQQYAYLYALNNNSEYRCIYALHRSLSSLHVWPSQSVTDIMFRMWCMTREKRIMWRALHTNAAAWYVICGKHCMLMWHVHDMWYVASTACSCGMCEYMWKACGMWQAW